MRIISWDYGVDVPYEGTSLSLEYKGDMEDIPPASPMDDYVDVVAYGPSVPNGRAVLGTYRNYDCAEEALYMIIGACSEKFRAFVMPGRKTVEKRLADENG